MDVRVLRKVRKRFTVVRPKTDTPYTDFKWKLFDHQKEEVHALEELEDCIDMIFNIQFGWCTMMDFIKRRRKRQSRYEYYIKYKNL